MYLSQATDAPPVAAPPRRASYLRLSRTRAVLLVLLVVASWLLIFDLASGRRHGAQADGGPTAASNVSAVARPVATISRPASPGPWGQLEVTPFTIEPPADFAARFSQADTTTWYFRN